MCTITTPISPATRQTAAERDLTRRIKDEMDVWYGTCTIDETRSRARRIGYYLPVPPMSWRNPIWLRTGGNCTIGAMQPATGWTPLDSTGFAYHCLSASSSSPKEMSEFLQRRLESLRLTKTSFHGFHCHSTSESPCDPPGAPLDISNEKQHPEEKLRFSDSNKARVERLEYYRTNRLSCEIDAILRLKVENREIDWTDFRTLSELVIHFR
jgi:hypothetical protein